MKKPTKKLQIKEVSSTLIDYGKYTPDQLRDIADTMDLDNVAYIRLEPTGWESGFEVYKGVYETQQEMEERYKKELVAYNSWKKLHEEHKQKRIIALEKEAKALGLKVIK